MILKWRPDDVLLNESHSANYYFKIPLAPNLESDIHYICDFLWKTAALAWEYLLGKFIVHA